MKKEMKEKSKDIIILIVCAVAFVALQVMVVMMSRINPMLQSYNGVLMAGQFGLCLVMIRRDYKRGYIISIILIAVATLLMISSMIRERMLTPLPGLGNTVIYIIALTLLARSFGRRENEALTDMLTGFFNRRGLQKVLRRKEEDGKKFHIIFVDISNFKVINDNYGHHFGDIVLKLMSERLRMVVGRDGVIARSGGDDFVVITNGDNEPVELANRILKSLREKVIVEAETGKTECYMMVYAGVAGFPVDSKKSDDVLKYADIAMFEATRCDAKVAYCFDTGMEESVRRHLEIKDMIIKALEKEQFFLQYQPQYRTTDKRLRGFEALVRMRTDDGTMVSPGEFISVAEKSDLILEIDEYVLRHALTQFKSVVKEARDNLILSVNVSARTFGSETFESSLLSILAETGFPAQCLEIEITEYCVVHSMEQTIENIQKLRDYDIHVAIDDFGTGYTALSYLAKMPITMLKIDKSLVDDICVDAKSRSFVSAIISMGHLMGCEVLTEGVEKETQLKILRERGSDYIQGFVWNRPLDFEAAQQCVLDSEN